MTIPMVAHGIGLPFIEQKISVKVQSCSSSDHAHVPLFEGQTIVNQ